MIFHPDTIIQAAKLLKSKHIDYKCSIIIGDNSSGKSLLVKMLINSRTKNENLYFVDAVNRNFDASKVTKCGDKPQYKETILETRMQEPYFNIQDSFNCYGTSTERIEQIYEAFKDRVQALFHALTGDKFEILYGNTFGEVRFANGTGTLSSGYQAMLRLLLELTYYYEMMVEENHLETALAVIDELDEFLSPKYAARILGFLRANFPKLQFIVTTHSADLVAAAQNAYILILNQDSCEVVDANDYNSFTEVQRIFMRVFGRQETLTDNTENILRRLMNNRINHAWSKDDEEQLKQLGTQKLTASQQLIYRQIMEW